MRWFNVIRSDKYVLGKDSFFFFWNYNIILPGVVLEKKIPEEIPEESLLSSPKVRKQQCFSYSKIQPLVQLQERRHGE